METGTLTRRAAEIAGGQIRVIDLTQTLTPEVRAIELPPQFGQCAPVPLGTDFSSWRAWSACGAAPVALRVLALVAG